MIVLVIEDTFLRKGMDIWYRGNMNWDEYRWGFDGQENRRAFGNMTRNN